MTLRVVYDTNVIVSAALKPGSLPASLVSLAMTRRVRCFVSLAILEEYEAVLRRPKFRLDPKRVEAFLPISEKPPSPSDPQNGSARLPMRPTTASWSAPSRPGPTIS